MRTNLGWLSCLLCGALGGSLVACGDDASTPPGASAAGSSGAGGANVGRGGSSGAAAGSAGRSGSSAGANGGASGSTSAGAAGSSNGGAAGNTSGGAAGEPSGGAAGNTNGGTAGNGTAGTAGNGGGGAAGNGTAGTAGNGSGGAAGNSTGGSGGTGGGTPSPTTGPCRVTGGPDVLLDFVQVFDGEAALADGTRMLFGDGGLCAVPVDGGASVLVATGYPKMEAVGNVVAIRTVENGNAQLRLWKRGLAEAVLVGDLGAADGDGAAIPSLQVLPGDERVVWAKKQGDAVSLRSFVFGGTDSEILPVEPGVAYLARSLNRVVVLFGSETLGTAVRMSTVDGAGMVKTLCEACGSRGPISARSPWIPLAQNPDEAYALLDDKDSTLALHHDTTGEKRDLSKTFQLGFGIHGGADGEAFFAANRAGLVAWHDPVSGVTKTSALPAKGNGWVSKNGRFMVVASENPAFFGVDESGTAHTWPITLGASEGIGLSDSFSTDGNYATYTSGSSANKDLYRVSLKTGETKLVQGIRTARSLSPARGSKTFAGDDPLMLELDLSTGLHVQLLPGSWPRTVPDNGAYTYVDPLSTLRRTPFPNEPGHEEIPPCGRSGPPDVLLDRGTADTYQGIAQLVDDTLFLSDGSALCAVFPDGTPSVKLWDDGTPIVTPEGGGRIAAFQNESTLSVWRRGLPAPRVLTNKFGRFLNSGRDLALSGDGARLLFLEDVASPVNFSAVRAYSFATNSSVVITTGYVDPSAHDAVQAAQGALVYRTLPALSQPAVMGSVRDDGSQKELCVGCMRFVASPASPWIFTGIPSTAPGTPPAATLIHAGTGERRDLSALVSFTTEAVFSEDGKKLFAPSQQGRIARYDVASGAVQQIGSEPGSGFSFGSFASTRDGSTSLYVVTKDGGSRQLFFTTAASPDTPTFLAVASEIGRVTPGPKAPFTWDEKFASFGVFDGAGPDDATFHSVELATGEITLLYRASAGRGLVGNRVLLEPPVIGTDVLIQVVQLPGIEPETVAYGRAGTVIGQGKSLAYIVADRRVRVIATP